MSLAALATGLICLHSCNTKEISPSNGEVRDIQVTVILDESETKTTNSGEATLWAENDRISAIGTEYGEEKYSASYLTYRGNNTFGGRVTYPGDDNNWYFVYPYREDNVNPHQIHITVMGEQEQTGNNDKTHIAGAGFPLIGKILDLYRTEQMTVHMSNVLTRLDYQVTNTSNASIVVKQVVFTTPKKIGGNFVGDMTNDNLGWTAESGASKSVTLNVTDGAEIAAGETAEFYAGILPTTIEAGESMKVKIVAVNPSAPGTDIVYYKAFNMQSNTHLNAGKTYSFGLEFDTTHSSDPLPGMDDDDEPVDPTPGGEDTPTTETAYVKVTSEPTTWDGTYLIVDENSSKAFAAFSANASSYAVNVTISNGRIAATSDIAKYAFTISDAGVKHANATSQEAYNIRNSEGKYIFWSSSTLQILDTNQKTAGGGSGSEMYTYYNTLAYSSNGVQVMSSGHSSGFSKYYLGYQSSAFNYDSEGESRRVQLYKFTQSGTPSDPAKQNQILSFSQSTVTTTASVGSTMSVQTVSGNQTAPVTYISSNSNVATVSNTTITIKGVGSTTITATAPESITYNSGSASYTLVVSQSGGGSSSGERTYTYTAPNSLDEGTYIIAGSETNELSVALFPNVSTDSWNSQQTGQVSNGQYVPHKVYGSNNSVNNITTTDSDIINGEVELVKNGNNWRILVKSNSQYLASPSAEYKISFTTAATSAASFSISSGTNGATVQTGSYYFYHSGSAGGFTLRTSSTSNLRFYKLTSGGDGSGKQYQSLSFTYGTETFTTESASGTYPLQQVNGARTSVTYSSSNTGVATINGNTLNITGFGSTTITANAISTDAYYSASASYTFTVKRTSQSGVYNLENEAIQDYFDRALNTTSGYTYDNHSSRSYVSTILNTYGNPSASNRIDWPAPVTVTWTQSSTASNRTLSVYHDQTYTNEEIMAVVELGSTSADIYNLIPGKTYYWVLMSGSSTIASGHFDTEGRRRMMAIGQKSNYGQNYANNCRDLGGQVTTNNKTIKYGKIYRGSNMDSTTDAQKTYLKTKMNIGLDVDLRTSGNSYYGGGNYLNNALGFSTNISVGDYNTYQGHTQEEYSSGSDLTNKNKMGPTLMRIMNAVHNGVNVYVHCMVGADRTGGTCLYLESLLGVAPERCDMDFELTSFSCVGSRTRNGSSPEQFYTVYNAIKNTNTGNANSTWQEKAIYYCVNNLGVDPDMITRFQNEMLE